jgi:hypothetical protein
MHIVIAIPTPEYSQADFALGNLQDIIGYTHKRFPKWKITTAYRYGTRTDQNRNTILQEVLKDDTVDYILWLDSDMLYPATIIERYFDVLDMGLTIDVIGCLYFKRSYPYDPIAYEYNKDPGNKDIKPYRTILPSAIREDTIIEVDGIGYGGMMVNMNVYKKLGDKKWTVYGSNFHLPFDAPDHMTHDLVFCNDVKQAGMSIKLHGAVRPGHFCLHPVTMEDWQRVNEEEFRFKHNPPKVLVIMPATNKEQATMAAEIMRKRAGADCDIAVVMDDEGRGFVHVVNQIAKTYSHEVIVYTAQDALVGDEWLKKALLRMLVTDAGLVSFHDGKWGGKLASFGMVQRSWFKDIYEGSLFYPGYWGNYADTELTQIAKQQGRYAYAPKAVMLEVDYEKALGRGKGVVAADKKLFKKRKKGGFGGLVTDKELLEEFS